MFFSCVGSFRSKKKKIPDLSLPPCIWDGLRQKTISRYCPFKQPLVGKEKTELITYRAY
jgi:hypothetical protein